MRARLETGEGGRPLLGLPLNLSFTISGQRIARARIYGQGLTYVKGSVTLSLAFLYGRDYRHGRRAITRLLCKGRKVDNEPPLIDAGDYRFNPIAECSVCDEPFKRGYVCSNCGADLCPECVSGPLSLIETGFSQRQLQEQALCPECPGACCAYYPA